MRKQAVLIALLAAALVPGGCTNKNAGNPQTADAAQTDAQAGTQVDAQSDAQADNQSDAQTDAQADTGADLSRGNALLSQGEYENAAAVFEQVIAGKTDLEAAYRGLGIARLALGDYEGAITAFDQALAQAGADAREMEYDISYYKASALVHLDRLNDALELYNNLVAYRPEVKTYTGRGAVYARMGNLDMARADFDQAISMDSKNYERYMEIYQVLAAADRPDVGQEYLKKALDIDKDKNKNRLEKGKVYYYMEQYDKARTELEQADSSQNPEVTLFLAKTYEALGDPSYAQTLYRQYLDQDGSDGSIYNLIAVSQMKEGDYEGGLATIQEGLEKANSSKQTLYRNEIAAYEYLLNFAEAKTKMEAYLAAYPEDSEAAREYIFLKSRSK